LFEKLLKIYLLGAIVWLGWKYQPQLMRLRLPAVKIMPSSERGIAITKALRSQSVAAGQPLFLYIEASSVRTKNLKYQWYFNNAPIPGAEGPMLTVMSFSRKWEGLYSVAVRDSTESIQSPQVRVSLERGLAAQDSGRASASAR